MKDNLEKPLVGLKLLGTSALDYVPSVSPFIGQSDGQSVKKSFQES